MCKCIYCGVSKQLNQFNREHVIPQSFGHFGTRTPVLRYAVCTECNNYFAHNLESIFARQSIEGLSRENVGITPSENCFTDPDRLVIRIPEECGPMWKGIYIRLDERRRLAEPLPQIHLKNVSTSEWEVFLQDEWESIDWTKYSECKVLANSDETYQEGINIVSAHGMRNFADIPAPPITEAGLPMEVEGKIDKIVKGALCKILFNFVAKYIGENEVLKSNWDLARNYIRKGEGNLDVSFVDGGFWGQESGNLRFASDGINILIHNHNQDVVGEIEFYNRIHYRFILAPSYHLRDDQEVGYRFVNGNNPMETCAVRRNTII